MRASSKAGRPPTPGISWEARLSDEPSLHSDALGLEFREQMVDELSRAVFLLVPFVIDNVLDGRWELALSTMILLWLGYRNGKSALLGRKTFIPQWFLTGASVLTMAMAVHFNHSLGMFWMFPAIVFFFVIQGRVEATLCSLLLIGTVIPVAWDDLGREVTMRMLGGALLTMMMAYVFLGIIIKLLQRLKRQALTDVLTGAYNRRHLHACLAAAVERRARHGTAASLVLFDIDHFKTINDTLGHEVGDQVLRDLVSVLSRRLRSSDMLFRIGGEEFVLLLGDTEPEQAAALAEELRRLVADSPLRKERPVTVSMGVAGLRAEESAELWIKAADDSLYAAKTGGRNRVAQRPPA